MHIQTLTDFLSMEDEGKMALKRPCDDHVDNSDDDAGIESHVNVKVKRSCDAQSYPSSASATASAGVTGGSIFKILAGRKALNCPCAEDLVNSASAKILTRGSVSKPPSVDSSACVSDASGKRAPRHPASSVGKRAFRHPLNPALIEGIDFELVTRESFYKPLTPLVYSSPHVDDGSEIHYRLQWEGGRVVTKIIYCHPHDKFSRHDD